MNLMSRAVSHCESKKWRTPPTFPARIGDVVAAPQSKSSNVMNKESKPCANVATQVLGPTVVLPEPTPKAKPKPSATAAKARVTDHMAAVTTEAKAKAAAKATAVAVDNIKSELERQASRCNGTLAKGVLVFVKSERIKCT